MTTIRFYTNGTRGVEYTTVEEIVAYLLQFPEDIPGFIDSQERLAHTSMSWGSFRHMRETYNHIVDVLTALALARGEEILE